ncbi:MAG: HNH endonuclease [Betaproteobacteria bacterium]|nr:HNH endonuclease [Betaproteobacteria bacterium]MCL2886514.1 HNH endonuclease [Betaproteobacteria bacterium]
MAARNNWTPDEIEMLKANYPDQRAGAIAAALGYSLGAVYRKAAKLGLKKSDAFYTSEKARRLNGVIGAETRFRKGHVSWNKGMKGLSYEGMKATQFKPGHQGGVAAARYQPIGAERISKDGYLQRKVNDGLPMQRRWRSVHILNWEAINGLLPAGHALIFRDGNKRNVAVDNLELVTRRELMARNTIHRLPPELKEVVNLKKAITRVINKMEKDHVEHD